MAFFTHDCSLILNHLNFFESCVLDFTALELLQEVVIATLGGLWVKHLIHHLLYHFILFPNESLLAQQLSPKLLINYAHVVQFLFKIDLFFI